MRKTKSYILHIITGIALLAIILPSGVTAKIFIETSLIAGQVISISEKNIIQLDNGSVYLPAHENIKLNIVPGQIVTIRYYILDQEEKRYIEVAPGKNSLKITAMPEDTTRPKSKL
ncbi:MAG: hypothetical protein L3J69_00435 [Desulfobacula sp.]|nr:hypothetical protein [Desulfobacula sp.]